MIEIKYKSQVNPEFMAVSLQKNLERLNSND